MFETLLAALFITIVAGGGEAARITTIQISQPLPSQGRLGGVAVSPAGDVYVSNFGGTVWRVTPSGAVEVL